MTRAEAIQAITDTFFAYAYEFLESDRSAEVLAALGCTPEEIARRDD